MPSVIPFLSAGPISVPMSSAYVISLLPKLDTSIKLAFPVDVVGAFQQDRSTGILGTMGDQPSMIPVSLNVRSSTNATNHYNVEVANDRYLTPILMNYAVVNAITASERGVGEMTLSVTGEVHIRNNDSVKIATMFAGDGNGPSMATAAAVAPIQYLVTGGYDGLIIDKVDFDIVSTDRKTLATLDRITVDRNEVRPGETLALSALMREPNGQTFIERYSVLIPPGTAGRNGSVACWRWDDDNRNGIEAQSFRNSNGSEDRHSGVEQASPKRSALRSGSEQSARCRDSWGGNAIAASVDDRTAGYRSGVQPQRYIHGKFGGCRIRVSAVQVCYSGPAIADSHGQTVIHFLRPNRTHHEKSTLAPANPYWLFLCLQ